MSELETIWLADELDERDIEKPALITGRHFEGVRLAGPALVHLYAVTMRGCTVEAPLDSLEAVFFEVPRGRAIGCCIGIRDTEIVNCAFRLVGFVGVPEDIAYFKRSLFGQGWDERATEESETP